MNFLEKKEILQKIQDLEKEKWKKTWKFDEKNKIWILYRSLGNLEAEQAQLYREEQQLWYKIHSISVRIESSTMNYSVTRDLATKGYTQSKTPQKSVEKYIHQHSLNPNIIFLRK
ncbi:MAG: hypothetical protein ACI86H_000715 [bacterium]|jgi:hypothetical protein